VFNCSCIELANNHCNESKLPFNVTAVLLRPYSVASLAADSQIDFGIRWPGVRVFRHAISRFSSRDNRAGTARRFFLRICFPPVDGTKTVMLAGGGKAVTQAYRKDTKLSALKRAFTMH